MKSVLVFGAGQVAEVFAAYLIDNGLEVASFVVDPDYWSDSINGIPVNSTLGVTERFPPSEYAFTIGMSFKGLNKVRAYKYEFMKALGYEPLNFIDERCRVTGNPQFEAGCFIQDGNCIQPGVTIGENVVGWAGNHWGHHSKIGNHVWVCSGVTISGACEIGDYSFLGVGATVIDGVKVGRNCIIGAEALVTKDVPDDTVIPGPICVPGSIPASKMRGIWSTK